MSTTDALEAAPASGQPGRRGTRFWIIAGAVGVAIALVVGLGTSWVLYKTRPVPEFPSLTASPDPGLHGTVAFVDTNGCVQIVAASGQQSKTVFCLPSEDEKSMVAQGKPYGPQLVWRADGRLEVTMFRFDGAPPFRAGWQKIVDVRTGQVTDVPAAQVPAEPNLTTQPTVCPDGDTLSYTSDRGAISIDLRTSTGTRSLLTAQGPPDGYGLGSVFWGPGCAWVVAEDTRVLIITTGQPPVTRTLVTLGDTGFGGDPGTARIAVTGEELLGGSTQG